MYLDHEPSPPTSRRAAVDGLRAGECTVNIYTTHDYNGGLRGSPPTYPSAFFDFVTCAAIMWACSCAA